MDEKEEEERRTGDTDFAMLLHRNELARVVGGEDVTNCQEDMAGNFGFVSSIWFQVVTFLGNVEVNMVT